jgi:hypothetical protein
MPMLQITLGAYGRVDEEDREFAPRSHCGWYRGMNDADIYTSARAWWVLNRARAEREKYAVVTAGGTAVQVIEIADWCTHPGDGRHAFSGKILSAGHPIYDRYVGKPLTAASRNPIHYLDDPDEPEATCKCGCGEPTGGTWVTGHDQRAIHDRIRRDFNGDVASFIDWYDEDPRP